MMEILLYEIQLEWNPRLFLIWDFSSSLSRASYEGMLSMLEYRKAVGRQRTKSENLYELSFQMCLIISGKEKTKNQQQQKTIIVLCVTRCLVLFRFHLISPVYSKFFFLVSEFYFLLNWH